MAATDGFRSDAEQARVQARLIGRAVTLTAVVASVLKVLRRGGTIADDEMDRYERELRTWNADARAIASEERP